MLVRAGDSLLDIDSSAEIEHRFRAEGPGKLREVLAHSTVGGVMVVVEFDGKPESEKRDVIMLDSSLNKVWSVPFPWAIGAAYDDKGTPYVLHADMVQLHESKFYPSLLQ